MSRLLYEVTRIFFLILNSATIALCQTIIKVDPADTVQRFEGWGTSLCWWANLEGSGSAAYRDKIAETLIDPDSGLGFTIFRYNIGGGDQPGHNHMRSGGAIPGFKPTETAAFDWTADQNQRAMVSALAEKAAQKKISLVWEAFSNSPPWWMTISGCAAGNADGADNLKSDYFDDFADYLTEVVRHFRDFWDITFRTIEPFNEPSSGFWAEGKNQEGCGFKAGQPRMVKALGNSLITKGLYPATTVSAADENAVDQAISGLADYDDSALSYLSQINTHTYYGRTATNFANLASLAAAKRKLLWQSETGPLAGRGNQDIAMFMSQYIIQDLRMLKPNAWLDWQTVGSGDWGTFQINRTSLALIPTRRFYMQAAFSRFIRPGAVFIQSSDSNSLAVLVPCTGNGVFIIRNGGSSAINYTWDLSRFTTLGTSAKVYQYLVSSYQTLSKLPDAAIANMQFSIISPAQSITTCIIPGIVEVAVKSRIESRRQSGSLSSAPGNGETINVGLSLAGRYSLTFYNSNGKMIHYRNGNGTSGSVKVDLGPMDLPGGVYIVQIRQGEANVSRVIHVVQK
jgi:O-glycosyl hydrolase